MSAATGSGIDGHFGTVGIWSTELRFGSPDFVDRASARLEDLGFGSLWFPCGRDDGVFAATRRLLDGTRRIGIGISILNIWLYAPAQVAAWWRSLPEGHRDRLLLGFGSSHGPTVGPAWERPLQKMRDYLDVLAAEGIPPDRCFVGALGPKMLALAAERTAGAQPNLTTPAHTATARGLMGPAAFLAPELGVVLDPDAQAARRKAREQLATYNRLPNYVASWKRMGFGEAEVAEPSDRFVDALFGIGSVDAAVEKVRAHLDAGADHVGVQLVLGAPGSGSPEALMEGWSALAPLAAMATVPSRPGQLHYRIEEERP